jgi:hypothetical protein
VGRRPGPAVGSPAQLAVARSRAPSSPSGRTAGRAGGCFARAGTVTRSQQLSHASTPHGWSPVDLQRPAPVVPWSTTPEKRWRPIRPARWPTWRAR